MRGAERQKGAIIVTVALTLLFLLGFMAIALDFGRLFIVKTELQTAVDSCALAAARELDGTSGALARAISAGKTAGNLNKVNFQGEAAGIEDADITFSDSLIPDGAFSHTFSPVANAKYAKCTRAKTGLAPWLLQTMGAFSGDTAFYGAPQGVLALAVATRTPAQSACAIPVQITPKTGGAPPDYGYLAGEWIPSLYSEGGGGSASNDLAPGHFGWANLDGSNSNREARDELLGNGYCDLRTGATIGSPGAMVGLRTAWNSRFGLYVNGGGNPKIDTALPDISGYAYTAVNQPSQANAWPDFRDNKRAYGRSYGDTTDTVNAGDAITGLNLPGNYNDNLMGTYAEGPRQLKTHGNAYRRVVLAPIVVGSTIDAFACVLMLHPMDGPNLTVYLEYIGNATASGSPCASTGLPGGTTGPLVSALAR